jgi:hypothetical protein
VPGEEVAVMNRSLEAVAIFHYFLSLSKIMTISLFGAPNTGVATPLNSQHGHDAAIRIPLSR